MLARYPQDVLMMPPTCPKDVPKMSLKCPHNVPKISPRWPPDNIIIYNIFSTVQSEKIKVDGIHGNP